MDQQNVPKIGIPSLVHSKHLNPDSIVVVDEDLALFDSKSIKFLYNGPTKLDVLTVGLCLQGNGLVNINLRENTLINGRMMVALPNQIVECRRFSADFKGIFFAISKNLLDTLPKVSNVLSLFFYLKDYPCFDLTQREEEIVTEYHTFISKRLSHKADLYRHEVMIGMMQGFFFELCNIFYKHTPGSDGEVIIKTRKEEVFEEFYEVLMESYQSERSVSYYAQRLCMTPKLLSNMVKDVSGKTVGDWVEELVILEAKALLNSTNLHLLEIADRLNFINQSKFGRYFKNITGISPKEYRQSR